MVLTETAFPTADNGITTRSEQLSLLPLVVQGYRFALPLTDVERLLPLVAVQPLPQAPDYFIGIMNIDGEPIPLIDLAGRMGIVMHDRYSIDLPLVLLRCGIMRGAVVVDEVTVVEAISRQQIRGTELFMGGETAVRGVVNMKAGMTLLMDGKALIDIKLDPTLLPLTLSDELRQLCSSSMA